MKILHINTHDTGGAATACRRIHLGLLERGVDSKVLYLKKTKNVKETYQFPVPKESIFTRIKNKVIKKFFNKKSLLDKYRGTYEIFSMPQSPYDITEHPLYKEADIIQLNWVSGFLDETTFFQKNTKPVVWRMADLYACGGGNHYEKNFPFAGLTTLIEKNKKIRKEALQNANVNFVCISNWVKQKADESEIIAKFPKTVIHNGVDLATFKPLDRNFARQVFNLPLDKKILLLGADSLANIRKGLDVAKEAIDKIIEKHNDVIVVTFGKQILANQNWLHVGEINDERLLATLYSAADFFVMSSIEEAFGQVTIEALACGLPVISFPTGGSLDVIEEEVNGFLATDFTSNDLFLAIEKGISNPLNIEKIVQDVRQRFNILDKTESYIDVYKSILEK